MTWISAKEQLSDEDGVNRRPHSTVTFSPSLPISIPSPAIPLRKTEDWAIWCMALSPSTYRWRLDKERRGRKRNDKRDQEGDGLL